MGSDDLSTTLAKMIKDPGFEKYGQEVGLSWLSMAQEAVIMGLVDDAEYLKPTINIDAITVSSLYPTAGMGLDTTFMRAVYCEIIDDSDFDRPVPVKLVNITEKGMYRNKKHGGTDESPIAIIYRQSSNNLIGFIKDNTGGTANLFYVRKPTALAVSGVDGATSDVDPIINGLDHLLLTYGKYMYHISEGQTELAGLTLQVFNTSLETINAKIREKKNV